MQIVSIFGILWDENVMFDCFDLVMIVQCSLEGLFFEFE